MHFLIFLKLELSSIYYKFILKRLKNIIVFFKKPIWVTEWNLQISQTTGNTLFQALFVAHYLLECMSLEALSSIELTTYHNLGGRDIAGSIFRKNDEITETHSTYYPMLMISKIFSNNITYNSKRCQQEYFLLIDVLI